MQDRGSLSPSTKQTTGPAQVDSPQSRVPLSPDLYDDQDSSVDNSSTIHEEEWRGRKPHSVHRIVLQKRKTKFKILTSSGSLQPLMANKDDDLSCSMNSGIPKGIICNTQTILAAGIPDNGKASEMEGMLQAGQTLGFGNTTELMTFENDIDHQIDREIADWTANQRLQISIYHGMIFISIPIWIFFWNCCGLDMSAKRFSIKKMWLHNTVDICFILKTKKRSCTSGFVNGIWNGKGLGG